MELGQFLAEHRDDGLTAKGEQAGALTITKWRASMLHLIKCFGYGRDIATITHDDARDYRLWLEGRRIK
jgi:hypothetical protein